jgi:DNA topoisomerase-1
MENYIIRKTINGNYEFYYKNNKKINEVNILDKIKKIYIPPAYKNVKIYLNKNILATGIDNAGRKQYIYSEEMKQLRERKKYNRLKILSENIQKLKKKINKDLNNTEFSKTKLIALLLKIMDLCNFRNGNIKYEKLYGTHGLTTLHKKHILIKNKLVEIEFIGKKGVVNSCIIKNKNIQKIIKKIYNISSKDDPYLFSINNNGKNIKILITDVNKYLEKFNVTYKDLRTWNANILFLKHIKKELDITHDKKKIIRSAIKSTALQLHHTPIICKSSYIYKKIIEYIEQDEEIINKLLQNENVEDILKDILSKP